jgi:dephospho-CoA kinase
MVHRSKFKQLDSDALIREQVLTNTEVIAALRDRFGPLVIKDKGEVDRTYLASRVFSNDEDRIWLEQLTHPRLFGLWRKALRSDLKTNWVIEVPLLFEKQLENWFDFIVCVASSADLQLARLEQRGIPRPLAEQRISKQLPLATKTALSDIVLWNDGSIDFLQKQVDAMIAGLPMSDCGRL